MTPPTLRILHLADPLLGPLEKESIQQLVAAQQSLGDTAKLLANESAVEHEECDVVHTHGYTARLETKIRWSAPKRPVHIHSFWKSPLLAPRGILDRMRRGGPPWIRSVDAIVTLCEADRLELASIHYAPAEKLMHVPPALNLEPYRRAKDHRGAFRAGLGLSDSCFVLGTISPFVASNNHEDLLRAAQLLLGQFPEIRLILVGDGPTREAVAESASKLGLGSHVRVVTEPVDRIQFQADIDLFVSTSSDDSFHLPLLEAFAAGNTAVASDAGAGHELRGMGNPLGVYPNGSVKDLVLVIQDICENRELYATLAREQKDVVIRTFHPVRWAKQMDGVYRGAMARSNQPPTTAVLRAGG